MSIAVPIRRAERLTSVSLTPKNVALAGCFNARSTKMAKTTRACYTLELKQEAARLVDGGQRIAAASLAGAVSKSGAALAKMERDLRC